MAGSPNKASHLYLLNDTDTKVINKQQEPVIVQH